VAVVKKKADAGAVHGGRAGPNDLEAVGDFIGHDYTFSRSGREAARVSKKWFRMSDTYGVEVAPGEDDVLILASTVVIDLCVHGDGKND
jgi:uncharacterized protein YxjI